ncbi:MAG: putative peptidoglycan-binding protein [Sedimentibacter sp.]|jgi:peptidoglycan hydrolase-like protein with peptidoglycan-binding domain|nr:putative peptidoglycan-binding protein [Sedimentibacter sp.]
MSFILGYKNNLVMQEVLEQLQLVTVPREITVHLGAPDQEAENITIPYIDYIKNVASSELYPTWPENALRANIHAITSIAMNRVYTEWYRSRGYNFDITNSTQFDQAYVPNRGIFDSISSIVDETFNQYIVREGQLQPLFATFCDGRVSQCDGLLQWGTVDLANAGYTPIEILRYYYGDNIDIVENAPVGEVEIYYPGEPLKLGDSSLDVLRMQLNLDRIRLNYPAIPEIQPLTGYFNESTEAAVREFQRVFKLPVTGVIDQGTWYTLRYIYAAVTKLAELTAQGDFINLLVEVIEEVSLVGDVSPRVEFIQYALNVLSAYYPTIKGVAITGIFDEATREQIIQFQKTMNLETTGLVDSQTLVALSESLFGILDTLPPEAVYLPRFRWPGSVFEQGEESPSIYVIQEMLSYISLIIPTIPYIEPNGVYDEPTQRAVSAFQTMQGIEPTGLVDEITWDTIVEVYRKQRYGSVAGVSPI